MPLLRAIVSISLSATTIPADKTVHDVFHNNNSAGGLLPVDYQNHADQVRDAFSGHAAGYTTFTLYGGRQIDVKVYDMADAKPRPVRAQSTYIPTTWVLETSIGPRQVALCLSFYGDRNLPRQRGRIYLGPYSGPSSNPTTQQMNDALTLGHALFDVGGANVDHVVYSRSTGTTHRVTDYWSDNRWDTQRRRLKKADTRVKLHP